MSIFKLSFIFIIISTLSMAALMFLKGEHKKQNTLWGFFCVCVATWGIGGYFGVDIDNQPYSYLGWQFANIGSIFTSVLFFHFINAYFNLNKIFILRTAYLLSIFYLFINFFMPELYFGNIKVFFNEFYYMDWTKHKNPIYLMFYITFFWALLLYSFFFLIKGYIKAHGAQKNQLKIVIIGMSIGWLGGHGDFLPIFGYNLYPYANFLIGLFPIIVTYAIIRHQFLEIEIVIKKSIVYSLSISIIFIGFLICILVFEHLFQSILGYHNMFATIITAIFIAIIFTPIKEKVQHSVDKLFFNGTTFELADENKMLKQEVAQADKLKAIATLASGMAHEIRNPLTAIKTFAEHLPNKKKDDEFLDKFAKIVGKEVHRVDDLVKQLLEFARPASLLLKDVDIHNLLKETLDFLNNKLIDQHINIKKEFEENYPLIIQADANQLKQVFLNLLLNAIDAMPGGGTLTIGVRVQGLGDRKKPKTNKPKSLHPTPYTLTPKIIISIKDTGCGIDKEAQKHIFEPFYSNKDHGTGLGLSITYGIIKEHKGLITVKSAQHLGTEFCITLPIKEKK